MRFYQRREVKDIISYLRVIQNPHDDFSLTRIINTPTRGIGQRTISQLTNLANTQNISLYDVLKNIKDSQLFSSRITSALVGFVSMLDALIEKSNSVISLGFLIDDILQTISYRDYLDQAENKEERWENVLELRNVAQEYKETNPRTALNDLLEKISLVSDTDEIDENTGAVTLITLHQAKGLEFPVVFIVGMEEGLLPHSKSLTDPSELEEERRLCYVGITRAKERLFLLYSQRRALFGKGSVNKQSRFLRDISPHLLNNISIWGQRIISPVESSPFSSDSDYSEVLELKVGDMVSHRTFGDGVVIDCMPSKGDRVITVSFAEVGEKRLLLGLAPLEKIEKD
jgi:DNA helicase-2/ATP-dependent DNA helicase PcrA